MKLALKFKDFPALTAIFKDFNDLRTLEKIVEQDFPPNFWVNFTRFFFAFFSSLLDWIVFILLHIAAGKISFPWTSKMTNLSLKQGLSEALQGIDVD